MFKIKISDHFSAAHQLSMINKKCENLHGHNWKVEVCVTKKKLDKTGILLDFGFAKKLLKTILEQLDHSFLNNIEHFNDNFPPSSENIAVYISKEMQCKLEPAGAQVEKVTVWESENSCAMYLPTKVNQ